jgi:hypothetical protein
LRLPEEQRTRFTSVLEEKLSADQGVQAFGTPIQVRNLLELTARQGNNIPSLRTAVSQILHTDQDKIRFDTRNVSSLIRISR